jgi:hypothetical protein
MKIKRFIVFTGGLTVGYLAGTAAGRERFEQIKTGTAAVAADLGLARVSAHLRLRSGEVARASVERAADTTCDGIDTTADMLEGLISSPDHFVYGHATSKSSATSAGPATAGSNGSLHQKHKGK